jgi:transposase
MARLAPKFVKPYVKNPKNDMADAGPIAEAPSRPTMRLVEVNTPEQQGLRVIFRLRDLLVGQRTQTVNALPGHLAEFGIVTAKGRENADKLRSALDRDEEAADTSATVRHMAQLSFDQINDLPRRIADLDAQIAAASKRSRFSARLQEMQASAPSLQWPWRLSLHRGKRSGRRATSRLGRALCPGSIRAVASQGSGGRANQGSGISGVC